MNPTGFSTIDHSPEVVAKWLDEIEQQLHWKDAQKNYHLLRATLHTLRDWLTVDEAADLAAQLPVLIRGIYYEGWDPSATPMRPRTREAFLKRLVERYAAGAFPDPLTAAGAVFAVLKKYVSEGEIRQVRYSLPRELQDLWQK
ncbi:MAG: DUF2267 domain-containing protein [Flavobacteriaceae bacterium]